MKRRVLRVGLLLLLSANALAQTKTTAQLGGLITDPSNAAVPKAKVTAISEDTGRIRNTESNLLGSYILALLDPGSYTITAFADGFRAVSYEGVKLSVDQSARLDFKLQLGSVKQRVVVSGGAPLIEPSNPNTSYTFMEEEVGALPNPGSDLTYIANLVPGAVMNSAIGGFSTFGNTEYNGLPSLSNFYSMDGLSITDSYLGTNIVGASGMSLGLNAVKEVSVNTEAYSTDLGGKGAAQIDFVTKSGTDTFHGNLFEVWNGSRMNARNFFLNANPLHPSKPRSNVNQFGASLGGPVIRNRLYFFVDVEGLRTVIPVQQTTILPTPSYQNYVLQQLSLGGMDTVAGDLLPPHPEELPFYRKMFQLFGDTSRGIPLPILGCPFDAGGGEPALTDDGNGCANQRLWTSSPYANETLFTLKMDYHPGPNDTIWFRIQVNDGSSTIFVDPVNSIFNGIMHSPERSAVAGWTHIFGSNLANQFNPGISYFGSVLGSSGVSNSEAAFPIALASPFSHLGGADFLLPAGEDVTQWQLNDNLAWMSGKHGWKFGAEFRQNLVRDFNYSSFIVPLMTACTLPEFTYGVACLSQQSFGPGREVPESYVNLDGYAMDTWKMTPNWTANLGLRVAWNSNLVSRQNAFARLNGESFYTIPHNLNRPLNQDILTGQRHLYGSTPLLAWQPRVALAYAPRPTTVFRAGFGVFTEVLDGIRALGAGAGNPPYTNSFSSGLLGSIPGSAIAPGVPYSAFDAAVAANQAFQQGFASGVLSCAATNAPPNCLPAVEFANYPAHMQPPYFLEWSLGVEHQIRNTFRIAAKYAGTRMVHALIPEDANGTETVCAGCFPPYSYAVSPDPRFATVYQWQSDASSSYHGLQISAEKRLDHGLQFLVNYTWSHCLGTASNDGFTIFGRASNNSVSSSRGDPKRQYGNCDFDVRHSLNGSFLYEFPFHSARSWLDRLVSGWQIAGTVFLHTGFPFTVYSNINPSVGFVSASPAYFAKGVAGQNSYAKSDIPGVTQPGTIQWLNPNAFQSIVDPSTNTCYPTNEAVHCQDGNLARNSLRAPDFRWADLDVSKRIRLTERISLKFETQFYNVFNHPNFGFPLGIAATAGIPGKPDTLVGFGTIDYATSPATGLLGANLGGDKSVRMIALRGAIEF